MISDEQLQLYHYGDGLDATERAGIAALLKTDADASQRLQRLIETLDQHPLGKDVAIPEQTLLRLRASLDRASRAVPVREEAKPSWRWGVALASVSAALLAVVTLWPHSTQRDELPIAHSPIAARDGDATLRYQRSLPWFFAQTELQLAQLDTASREERAQAVESLLAQNRLYSIVAERANDPTFARTLRSFAPILEEIAGDQASKSEVEGAVAQLNFELKVVQARLAANAAPVLMF